MRRGLRFIVLIREAFESLSFGGVITGQHFLLSYFKTLSDGPAGVELMAIRSPMPPVRGLDDLEAV